RKSRGSAQPRPLGEPPGREGKLPAAPELHLPLQGRVVIVIAGGARAPILVLAMGGAFVLLVIALLIGSLTRPEFPPYALTAPHAASVGDSLVGPATYTLDAAATDRWRRFDFGRNAAVDSGPWDIAFRRFHVIAAPGGGVVDLGA